MLQYNDAGRCIMTNYYDIPHAVITSTFARRTRFILFCNMFDNESSNATDGLMEAQSLVPDVLQLCLVLLAMNI